MLVTFNHFGSESGRFYLITVGVGIAKCAPKIDRPAEDAAARGGRGRVRDRRAVWALGDRECECGAVCCLLRSNERTAGARTRAQSCTIMTEYEGPTFQ